MHQLVEDRKLSGKDCIKVVANKPKSQQYSEKLVGNKKKHFEAPKKFSSYT